MEFTNNQRSVLIFDGAMGTMLQNRGLKIGGIPEMLNLTNPEIIESIHREYLEAGADVILANTFGANRYKAQKAGHSVEELVTAAVKTARKAVEAYEGKFVALDIGPCGRVMEPTGDLSFEEAVEVFAEIVRAGDAAGADMISLETFTDLYEIKAAMIAAKENSRLPLLATMSFEENGTTFFGTTVESMVMTLEALGADALGVNCSLGPKQLEPIVERVLTAASIPVIVQPNAGLPVIVEQETKYDITAEEFAQYMKKFAEAGVSILGGCCGTTPQYIRNLKAATAEIMKSKPHSTPVTAVCSPSKPVYFGKDTVIIGERLNPTGKKSLQTAIRNKDMDFILREAIRQQDQGASVLDVNMGLPDIDEAEVLASAVKEIQAISDLPLQLDSSNPQALERAARIYNGKPLINSVNGKEESLSAILPIAKKYGAAVLGLTLDDNGIPETAEARLAIAEKIMKAAIAAGIRKEDLLIDCLVMTASAQQSQAGETLKAVRLIKEKLGLKTVLGVSNVSFGLPSRPIINRTMLAMALAEGLDAPIMNPQDSGMAETVAAYRVLSGKDRDSSDYIEKYSGCAEQPVTKECETASLPYAIVKGLKKEARTATELLLTKKSPLEIIETIIVPALDSVGQNYENQKIFLPQLIKSAEAAKSSFERLREDLAKSDVPSAGTRTKIVLATVHGDIHDIGKNIVKVIMENYNFEVIDLGRDVPPERVVAALKESGAALAGLSALMTTTVASMKTTIEEIRKECPHVTVIVGGAVLTPALAIHVGADFYAKDAMESVRIAGKHQGTA